MKGFFYSQIKIPVFIISKQIFQSIEHWIILSLDTLSSHVISWCHLQIALWTDLFNWVSVCDVCLKSFVVIFLAVLSLEKYYSPRTSSGIFNMIIQPLSGLNAYTSFLVEQLGSRSKLGFLIFISRCFYHSFGNVMRLFLITFLFMEMF